MINCARSINIYIYIKNVFFSRESRIHLFPFYHPRGVGERIRCSRDCKQAIAKQTIFSQAASELVFCCAALAARCAAYVYHQAVRCGLSNAVIIPRTRSGFLLILYSRCRLPMALAYECILPSTNQPHYRQPESILVRRTTTRKQTKNQQEKKPLRRMPATVGTGSLLFRPK